jgi:hypothetical protein
MAEFPFRIFHVKHPAPLSAEFDSGHEKGESRNFFSDSLHLNFCCLLFYFNSAALHFAQSSAHWPVISMQQCPVVSFSCAIIFDSGL